MYQKLLIVEIVVLILYVFNMNHIENDVNVFFILNLTSMFLLNRFKDKSKDKKLYLIALLMTVTTLLIIIIWLIRMYFL